jgi:hypothetical protein
MNRDEGANCAYYCVSPSNEPRAESNLKGACRFQRKKKMMFFSVVYIQKN